MSSNLKSFIYLIISLITIIAGYAYIRLAYNATDSFPFTQEFVLIILSTLTTIFITALLLNKQTAVEIEKEQNVLHLNLKAATYQKLLKLLEEMTLKEKFSNKELIQLQFITHELSIIASTEVIEEYQTFLKVIKDISSDESFSGDEPQLHNAISALCIKIRIDITGGKSTHPYTDKEISSIITRNSKIAMLFKKN